MINYKSILKFSPSYFTIAMIVLITEILIALYVHDAIIRPFLGDVLVVILIYCFIKAFIKSGVMATAMAVLVFAICIEIAQWCNLVDRLGLQHSSLARTVLGTSFSAVDIAMYIIGFILIITTEWIVRRQCPADAS